VNKFRLIVPAAGTSRRFRDAGYATPKPDLVIEFNGEKKKMLDWVLDEIPFSAVGPVVIAAHPHSVGPDAPHCSIVVHNSRGQAHAVLCALDATTPERFADVPVLVMNCDMVICLEDIVRTCEQVSYNSADVGILTTESKSEAYSYVNSFPFPTRFAEKRAISAHAMVGAWAFRSSRQLRDALQFVCRNHNEPYLSAALAKMSAVFKCAHASSFLDWGTPESIAASGARIVDGDAA